MAARRRRAPRTWAAVGLLGLWAAASARADPAVTEATPKRAQGWLEVEVLARDLLDARIASTVDSGLPGTCVYHIALREDDHEVVTERVLEMSLRFDLWDDRYVLEGPEGVRSFATLAAADSAWAHLDGVRLIPVSSLQSNLSYRLQVRVAVQPLAPEDQAWISRYVSQSSGAERQEFALDVGALLERFFHERSDRQSGAAYLGPPFRLPDVEETP
jgi:hypothetical protein